MNRPENQTLPGRLHGFDEGECGADCGGVMAGSTILALPVIICFRIVQRKITTRMTAGAATR